MWPVGMHEPIRSFSHYAGPSIGHPAGLASRRLARESRSLSAEDSADAKIRQGAITRSVERITDAESLQIVTSRKLMSLQIGTSTVYAFADFKETGDRESEFERLSH
jgi:hypothetical protein